MDPDGARSFDDLVVVCGPRLLRTCYLLTGDRMLAEDLLQTALATTYLRWDRLRDPAAAEAYVRAVAAHTAAKWWRRRWTGEVATGDLPDLPALPDADAYVSVEDRVSLRRALLALPPGQRAAVVLRFFDDLPEAEVAVALGVSVGTVKSRTSRALDRLRQDASVAAMLDVSAREARTP